jgi:hypothetical protein
MICNNCPSSYFSVFCQITEFSYDAGLMGHTVCSDRYKEMCSEEICEIQSRKFVPLGSIEEQVHVSVHQLSWKHGSGQSPGLCVVGL